MSDEASMRPIVERALEQRMRVVNAALIAGDAVLAGASLATLRRLAQHPAVADRWSYTTARARLRIAELDALAPYVLATPPTGVVEYLCDVDLRAAARELRRESDQKQQRAADAAERRTPP